MRLKPASNGNPKYNGAINVFAALLFFYGCGYIYWRLEYTYTPQHPTLWAICIFCEAAGILNFFFFILNTWDMGKSYPFEPLENRSVDVFITTYNEGLTILEPTLEGCRRITYPHTTYLLDDGKRPEMRELAERYGAIYLTRSDNQHAKAGNLNAALKKTSGEFIVTLDADMVPQPGIIDECLGFFIDEKVAIVQNSQEFYNLDSTIHFKSNHEKHGVGTESWLFHRNLQPGRNAFNAGFWCGTPSIIRRSALEDVGGIATKVIVEDYHTSLILLSRNWKIIATDQIVAFGIAPQNLEALLIQRGRWCEGTTKLLLTSENPLILRGLTFGQRLALFAGHYYYLMSPIAIFWISLPFLLNGADNSPLNASFFTFMPIWSIFFFGQLLVMRWKSKKNFSFFPYSILGMLHLFTLPLSCLKALLPFKLNFKITPKENDPNLVRNRSLQLLFWHFSYFLLLSVSTLRAAAKLPEQYRLDINTALFMTFGIFWLIFNFVLFAGCLQKIFRKNYLDRFYRFPVIFSFKMVSGDRSELEATSYDASLVGLGFRSAIEPISSGNLFVKIEIFGNSIEIPVKIVWKKKTSDSSWVAGIEFLKMSMANKSIWINFLFIKLPKLWPSEQKPVKFTRGITEVEFNRPQSTRDLS